MCEFFVFESRVEYGIGLVVGRRYYSCGVLVGSFGG